MATPVAVPRLLIAAAAKEPSVVGQSSFIVVMAETGRHGVMMASRLIAEGGSMPMQLSHGERPAATAREPTTLEAPTTSERVEAEGEPLLLDGAVVEARPTSGAGGARFAQGA